MSPTRPSLRRRRFLAGGVGLLAPLAGCSALADPRLAHYVEAFNYDDEPHAFRVRVVDDASGTLYDESFDLDPRRADETTDPFGGDPARAVVTEDGGDRTFAWPAPDCEARGSRSAGGASLSYTAEDDGPVLDGTCNTVTRSRS